MTTHRERKCWWCGKKLAAVSHAEVKDRDGNTLLVHKCCEEATMRYVTPVTAQPPEESSL